MSLYISATRQDDGKTVVSLGLLHALRKKVGKIGYIKPVGQQYLTFGADKIDKDVVLMNRIYHFPDRLIDMSPIAVPKGFTEAYIRHPRKKFIQSKVRRCYRKVADGKDLVLVEGTGHAGVGSVFDLSNAKVAQLIGAKVIIVCLGGVGRPIDEIFLNQAIFHQYGVEILGVIVNKVKKSKFDKVNTLVRKCLRRQGLEVLGVIPFDPVLSNPTIREILRALNGELISGDKYLDEQAGKFLIGAMPLSTAFDYFKGRYLLITPGNREDLILASLSHALTEEEEKPHLSGIILTGGILPHRNILNLIKKTNFPLILVKEDTYNATSRITNLSFKIKADDIPKVRETQKLVEKYVDVDRIIELLKKQPGGGPRRGSL